MFRVKRCLGALVALTLVLPALAGAQAPAGQQFTVEKLIDLGRVADPQLSPDGRHVAYVVTTVSLAKGSRASHIWLVPVAGGAPTPLLRPDGSDSSPRWSPDG